MKQKLAVGAAGAVILLAGGGFWLHRTSTIEAAYAEAYATCQVDEAAGSARVAALDELYGEAARPRELRLGLSVCELGAAVDLVQEGRRLLHVLTRP